MYLYLETHVVEWFGIDRTKTGLQWRIFGFENYYFRYCFNLHILPQHFKVINECLSHIWLSQLPCAQEFHQAHNYYFRIIWQEERDLLLPLVSSVCQDQLSIEHPPEEARAHGQDGLVSLDGPVAALDDEVAGFVIIFVADEIRQRGRGGLPLNLNLHLAIVVSTLIINLTIYELLKMDTD